MKRPPYPRRPTGAFDNQRKPRTRRSSASGNVALIPLDTAKIREQTLRKHRKAERELARLTDQLKRYHEHDVPGYHAWKSRTFGPLLSEMRELVLAMQEKETFVSELSELAYRLNLSEEDAYRELMWRRANPEAAAEKDRLLEIEEARQREAEEKRRVEREARRKKAKGRPTAKNPFDFPEDDELDDMDDEALFKEFISTMFGEDMFGEELPPGFRPKRDKRENKTAKELYRAIVLNLHPDHHGQMSEAGKHLWNEAQQAYRAGDVETLQTVLAQCESGEAGLGPNTAVSVILHLIRRLRAAMQPVRRQLSQARRSFEWEYEKRIGDPHFVSRIESLLREDIRRVKRALRDIVGLLETLKSNSTRKPRRKTRSVQSDPFFPGFNFPEDPLPF